MDSTEIIVRQSVQRAHVKKSTKVIVHVRVRRPRGEVYAALARQSRPKAKTTHNTVWHAAVSLSSKVMTAACSYMVVAELPIPLPEALNTRVA